jgi:4-amino-4-deoxy-L-arabinose transferase-like glycosyltransferase
MKTKNFLLVLVVLIIAIFLRVYHLTSAPPGLYPDEAMNGSNALEALETGNFRVFYPENNGREGLFINIQAIFVKYLGNYPWVLRTPSVIFGILTVLGLYLLTKELFSRRLALLSSFFLATSFWHINFSRIGFRAITSPFWLTWALYFLIAGFRRMREKKSSLIFFILSGLSYGAGFHSYIAYRATPPLILLVFAYFFIKAHRENLSAKFWKSFAVFTVAGILAIAPLLWYFAANPGSFLGRTSQVSVFASPSPAKDLALNIAKTLGMFNIAGDFNWRHNLAGSPELFWPVGLAFLIGAGILLGRLWRGSFSKEKDFNLGLWTILGWLALSGLPVVISNEGLPHALRAILMIPPVFMLAAIGASWLYERFRANLNPKFIQFFAGFIFALLIGQAYVEYFVLWVPNQNTKDAFAASYVDLAQQINAAPKNTAKYIVVDAGGVPVNGIPMPAQTVMFLTKSYTLKEQQESNIHYVLPNQESEIPEGALVYRIR